MKFSFKNIILFVAIILCVLTMATVFNGYGTPTESLTYSQVLTYLDEGKVESFSVESDGVTMKLNVRTYKDGKEVMENGKAVTKLYTYRISNSVQFDTIEAKAQAELAGVHSLR